MVHHHYHPAPAAAPVVPPAAAPVAPSAATPVVPPAAAPVAPPTAAVADVDADARPVARVIPMARVNLVQGSFGHFFLNFF